MLREYNVYMDKNMIGKAEITQEGLYYRIKCRCKISSKEIHRILLRCKEEKFDLGVCVPDGDFYCTSKLIPAKRIQDGDLQFEVIKSSDTHAGTFYEVNSTMPFAHLCRLDTARFERQNGVPVIRIC